MAVCFLKPYNKEHRHTIEKSVDISGVRTLADLSVHGFKVMDVPERQRKHIPHQVECYHSHMCY